LILDTFQLERKGRLRSYLIKHKAPKDCSHKKIAFKEEGFILPKAECAQISAWNSALLIPYYPPPKNPKG